MPFGVATVYRVISVGVLAAIFAGTVTKFLKWDEICASRLNIAHGEKSGTANRKWEQASFIFKFKLLLPRRKLPSPFHGLRKLRTWKHGP